MVLVIGVLLIVLWSPPRTLCDSQVDTYKKATQDFLGKDPKKLTRKTSQFSKLLETCKVTNSAGGCYELFMGMKRALKHTDAISPECYSKLGDLAEYKGLVWDGLDRMVRLAWGGQPPETPVLKTGWFDAADLNLFCQLKSQSNLVYGEAKWAQFIEGYFKELPGATTLPRAEAWQKMLFSVNCTPYM